VTHAVTAATAKPIRLTEFIAVSFLC
jgi:hypothetical protein